MNASRRNDSDRSFFLPDFCASQMALAIVLIVELVALVISLGRQAIHDNFWVDLASTSMFLLWVGLGSAMVLCRARPALKKMSTARASVLTLALLVGVVGVVSELTFQLGLQIGGDIVAEHFPGSSRCLRPAQCGDWIDSQLPGPALLLRHRRMETLDRT